MMAHVTCHMHGCQPHVVGARVLRGFDLGSR